ncbi:condensation domain-containing protein, partial [Streptomyces sp. NPDC058665]|uniref:condensation domain-containing protein n=1 Tax=Streptomyces sp. NPDC058665 TaxID=3346586 RepID=UPI00366932F1
MSNEGSLPTAFDVTSERSPIPRVTDEQWRSLSAAKRQLLQRRLTGGVSGDVLVGLGAGEGVLSPAQEALWFLWRLGPGVGSYNVPSAFRLVGRLDVGALEGALAGVVGRHEVLRTRFVERGGSVVQEVLPAGPVRVEVVSVPGGAGGEGLLEELVAERAGVPFVLDGHVPLRVVLFRLGVDEHVLLVVTHHAFTDAWSDEIFWRELTVLYGAAVGGGVAGLPELGLQFLDVARWQYGLRERVVLDAHLDYWGGRLAGVPVLDLPVDRVRPAVQSGRAGHVGFVVPAGVVEGLRRLARGADATMFMTLLAVYQAFLGRVCGQRDVTVGCPMAGRSRPEVAPLIGYFVNTVVLRGQCEPGMRFVDFLGQVRGSVLEGMAHQDVPFSSVVERVQPARDPSRNPLYQAMFTYQGPNLGDSGEVTVGDLTLHSYPVDKREAPADLALGCSESGDGTLRGTLEYNEELFERDSAERMGEGFLRFLRAVAEDPQRRLDEISILSPADRTQLAEWTGSASARRTDGLLLGVEEYFARQAEETPDTEALRAGGTVLTYRELHDRIRRLAAVMSATGVQAGDVVAAGLPRGVDAVVVTLATMSIGAVHAPINAEASSALMSHLIGELRPVLLVVGAGARVDTGFPAERVLWMGSPDTDRRLAEADPQSLAPAHLNPDALAYIVFTSGSADTPKGVMVTRRNYAGLRAAWADEHADKSVHRWLSLASPDSDLFMGDLVHGLAFGGTLVLETDGAPLTPSNLLALIHEERVNAFAAAPSTLEALAEHCVSRAELLPNGLRLVVSGGETMSGEPVERLKGLLAPGARVPLCRPMRGETIEILDECLERVPVGHIGELFVGGAGVARGYLGRPGATAERFLPAPFGDEPGARMYRTGVRGRWLSGGVLEILGRRAIVERSPLVDEAFGFPRLPGGEAGLDQLPVPDAQADDIQPPEPGLETAIAEIFEDLLGDVDEIGRHDNFFDIGGHSLIAMRVKFEVQERLGLVLEHADFYQHPTVAGAAALLRSQESGPVGGVSGDVLVGLGAGEGVLSPAQEALWFLWRLGPGVGSYNVPSAFRLVGRLDVGALEGALAGVVGRHEVLRTRFVERGGSVVQEVLPAGPVRVEVVSVPGGAGGEGLLEELVAERAGEPFDLDGHVPLRVVLFRLGVDEHVLLVVTHHAFTDAWSDEIFWRELTVLYGAAVGGGVAGLPELGLQFLDVARWQYGLRERGVLDAQLDYWGGRLAGVPVLDLPVDRVRPAVQSGRAGHVGFVVPAGVVEGLRRLARGADATMFMTLLAVYQAFLGRVCGQRDVTVGCPMAGRSRPEVAPLIGYFVNTVVLRGQCEPGMRFVDFLGQVRGSVLEGMAHQDVPFSSVVERVQPARDPSRNPLYQAMFTYFPETVTEPLTESSFAGITATRMEPGVGYIPADLDLTLVDAGDVLHGGLAFRLDLFDEVSVRGLVDRFVRFLECVAVDPGVLLGDVELLSGEERGWLGGVGGLAEGGPVGVVSELFEAQVVRSPSGVAVVAGGVSLSFAELNVVANRLARLLVSRGVGPESRVALGVSRSVEMVVAVLAVLKAGGVYVPVGDDLPVSRVRAVLDDAGPVVVLGDARSWVSWPEGTEWVDLAGVAEEGGGLLAGFGGGDLSDVDRLSPLLPEHAAYMIFTSGSTGRPKGVVIPHRGVCNMFWGHHEAFREVRAEGMPAALTAPLSFDTHWEALLWMFEGNELHIVDSVTRLDMEALARYVADHRIGFMDITPSVVRQLAGVGMFDEGHPRPAVLSVGGEAMDQPLWEQLSMVENVAAYNFYGPTECTVDSTFARVVGGGGVSIGRPLVNVRVCVVDEWGG